MSKLIFVEDEATARSMQRGLDPAVVRFSHPCSLLAVDPQSARFDEVYVRYPSPDWFLSTGWREEDFKSWMRDHATHCMVRGGDFQQI